MILLKLRLRSIGINTTQRKGDYHERVTDIVDNIVIFGIDTLHSEFRKIIIVFYEKNKYRVNKIKLNNI